MKLIHPILITSLLLLAGCQQNESQVYKLTERDSLNFLVSNSDLIAVVDILDGSDVSPDAKNKLYENVRASIQETILWEGSELKNITIHYEPFYKLDSASIEYVFFYKGLYLSFLKYEGENNFKPTTGNSLFAIFGANRVEPIWKQCLGNKEAMSTDYKLSDIISEIMQEQKKFNKTINPTGR